MHFDFDQVIERRGTGSAKFDFAQQNGYPADILPLWVADMDFQAPPCVIEALHKRVEHGIFGYTDLMDGYFAAVERWFRERFHWQLQKEWLVTTPGVVFALSAAVRVMTRPGDSVLVQTPVYYPFYRVIQNNGRKIVENPLQYHEGTYTVDFEDLEKKILEEDVKLLILCSPHNPICRVWTVEELQKLGAICKKHRVQVIADEIHCDFALPGYTHTPFLVACPDLADRTLVCTAPSKTFNLAGMQVSNIFIPGEELRNAYREEMDRISYHGPSCLGITACQAAYEGGGEWLEACKTYMLENLCYVRDFLTEHLPGIRLVEPEGTYFAWLDCTGLGLSKEALDDLIVHKAGLWLDSGAIFGDAAQLFQRVVLACPRATLQRAMENLKKALD